MTIFLFSCVGSKKKLLIDNLHLCTNCMVTNYFKEEETSYLLIHLLHLITLKMAEILFIHLSYLNN